jgi:hypothetical protein
MVRTAVTGRNVASKGVYVERDLVLGSQISAHNGQFLADFGMQGRPRRDGRVQVCRRVRAHIQRSRGREIDRTRVSFFAFERDGGSEPVKPLPSQYLEMHRTAELQSITISATLSTPCEAGYVGTGAGAGSGAGARRRYRRARR